MENEKNPEKEKELTDNDAISLSAALLAPLNAIFEAQVHSARSFLNFIFQMGFRHKYLDDEKKELESNREKNKAILDEIDAEKKGKDRIEELTRQKQVKPLSPEELDELWTLRLKWNDLILQKFDYFDPNGNVSSAYIPNLTLLPVKPLAVDNANFKFELNVMNSSESFDQMGTVKGASKDRPWFLIKPKKVCVEYSTGRSDERNIKIEINVKSAEMPYGLDKLLTSLTQQVNIIEAPKK